MEDKKILLNNIDMDMYQKIEMRKNKKMNEDTKSLSSTNINWGMGTY